jgi:hypothetical protein
MLGNDRIRCICEVGSSGLYMTRARLTQQVIARTRCAHVKGRALAECMRLNATVDEVSVVPDVFALSCDFPGRAANPPPPPFFSP